MSTRLQSLNNFSKTSGNCILYIMSRDQRAQSNHALLQAQESSLVKKIPVIVLFNLLDNVPNRKKNHFEFMLSGLQKTQQQLQSANINFLLSVGDAFANSISVINTLNPAEVYFDFSPLRGPQKLQTDITQAIHIPCFVVDTHNIIPVWEASTKQEHAAYTFRPKVYSIITQFLQEPSLLKKQSQSIKKTVINSLKKKNIFIPQYEKDWNEIRKQLSLHTIQNYSPVVKPGWENAKNVLQDFLENKLHLYATHRNLPTEDFQSNLSAYLHFGQISSLRVTLEIIKYIKNLGEEIKFDLQKNKARKSDTFENFAKNKQIVFSAEAFLEELIVRKELSDNFCYYNNNYDSLKGAKEWAKQTLNDHVLDTREYLYSLYELEHAKTHDNAWNAAQIQMVTTGKMHGYMRMYWAKKILEWTKTPKQAIEFAVYLNDSYELDGYDPNGYAGIMWSIAGIHDRGWTERKIFGKIRYMNYEGLKRKFDIDTYIKKYLS